MCSRWTAKQLNGYLQTYANMILRYHISCDNGPGNAGYITLAYIYIYIYILEDLCNYVTDYITDYVTMFIHFSKSLC